MTIIPRKIRRQIEADGFMLRCIHEDKGICEGRITWEHAILIGGRRVNERWAIVPCCWHHNVGVSGKDKQFNTWVALLRLRNYSAWLYRKKQMEKYDKFDFLKAFESIKDMFVLDDYPMLEVRLQLYRILNI